MLSIACWGLSAELSPDELVESTPRFAPYLPIVALTNADPVVADHAVILVVTPFAAQPDRSVQFEPDHKSVAAADQEKTANAVATAACTEIVFIAFTCLRDT